MCNRNELLALNFVETIGRVLKKQLLWIAGGEKTLAGNWWHTHTSMIKSGLPSVAETRQLYPHLPFPTDERERERKEKLFRLVSHGWLTTQTHSSTFRLHLLLGYSCMHWLCDTAVDLLYWRKEVAMEACHYSDMCPMAASKLYTAPKLSTRAKIPFVYIGIMTA